MLTKMSLRNLACFGDGDNHVDFTPETVIIGPNNVGKSAFIAGFNSLLSFVQYGSWQWNPPYYPYSWISFGDAVHRHEEDREIQLEASFDHGGWSGTVSGTYSAKAGGRLGVPRTPEMIEELKKFWFLKAARREIPRESQIGSGGLYVPWQPLNLDGSNVVPYLLERFTGRDPRWSEAENWIKRIAPETSVLKVPLRVMQASVETTDTNLGVDINMAYQGTGVQNALSIVAATVFSPEGSTIIIEEPETNLHPRSQETLVDLFNLAVRDWKKQIIFTTHSWDMILPFASDVATGSKRGAVHISAKPENFRMIEFDRVKGAVTIKEFRIKGEEWKNIKTPLKELWG